MMLVSLTWLLCSCALTFIALFYPATKFGHVASNTRGFHRLVGRNDVSLWVYSLQRGITNSEPSLHLSRKICDFAVLLFLTCPAPVTTIAVNIVKSLRLVYDYVGLWMQDAVAWMKTTTVTII